MTTTQLQFPGFEPQTITTNGTTTAHNRAVRAAVDAGFTAMRQELARKVETAQAAHNAVLAGITHKLDRTPEERAEQDRLHKEARRTREALALAKVAAEDVKVIRKLKAHPIPAPWCGTPAAARTAARKPNPVPQPETKAYEPGSWVRWNDPIDGRLRFGVVVSALLGTRGGPTIPALPKNGRHVLPADGGDAVAIGPGFARALKDAAWQVYGRSAEFPTIDTYTYARVSPALAQDSLFELSAA